MLRLATRIGLGFGASIIALVLVLGVTLAAFQLARQETARVHDVHIPNIHAAGELIRLLERMDNIEYLYLAAARPSRAPLQQFDATAREFERAYARAEAVVTIPDEAAVYGELGRDYGAFLHIHQRIRNLAAAGKWGEARALNASESLQAEIAFRQAGRRFVELNLAAADRAQDREQRALLMTELLAVSIALAGALLAAYLWRRAARDIVQPLDGLRHAAVALSNGLAVGPSHPAAAKTEEIAVLQAEFQRMAHELRRATVAQQTTNSRLESDVAHRTAELREANERLQEVVAELRKVDRLKSDFLAVTSHELLTPLAFIVGFASSLEDGLMGALSPAQAEAVAKILEGAERLTRMVRNTLEYSQAEAGQLSVQPEEIAVGEIAHGVAEATLERGRARGLTQFVAIAEDLPLAWADPERVAQVLSELLDNAIKFTPPGGHIRLSASADEERVILEVTDTGPGIPPDAIERLYQPFFQVDSSRTRAHGGLGLGLALAHRIAERMGGELAMRSRLARGSTFRLSLPRADRVAAAAPLPGVRSVVMLPPGSEVAEQAGLNRSASP